MDKYGSQLRQGIMMSKDKIIKLQSIQTQPIQINVLRSTITHLEEIIQTHKLVIRFVSEQIVDAGKHMGNQEKRIDELETLIKDKDELETLIKDKDEKIDQLENKVVELFNLNQIKDHNIKKLLNI